MRKIFFSPIVLCFLSTVFMLSCKKTNADIQENIFDEKASITSQSFNNQVEYAETNLKKITTEIAKLTKDPAFVSFIHSEVSKKFDGEFEVLIDDLKKKSTWSSKLNSKLMNEGLNAFKNIPGQGGGSFNPQIYIPKFQHDEETNTIASTTSNIVGDTILFITYGGGTPTDVDKFQAYYLDENNNLVYWGLVNEEYANNHEVWITAINDLIGGNQKLAVAITSDCMDEYGQPMICSIGGGGGGSGGGGGTTTNPDADPEEMIMQPHPDMNTHTPVNCKIENMSVRVHNEYWVSGGSEIAIRAKLHCYNDRLYGQLFNPPTLVGHKDYTSDQYSGFIGKFIRKFSRYEVNHGSLRLVNYPLQVGWPTDNTTTAPIYFDYVIFERDLFPAGRQFPMRQYRDFINPGDPLSSWAQFYRSQDPAYITNTVKNVDIYTGPSPFPTYYNNRTVNTPADNIFFDLKAF